MIGSQGTGRQLEVTLPEGTGSIIVGLATSTVMMGQNIEDCAPENGQGWIMSRFSESYDHGQVVSL